MPGTSSFGDAAVAQSIRAEYEVKLQQYKIAKLSGKQFRTRHSLKMKEEQNVQKDELMHQMERRTRCAVRTRTRKNQNSKELIPTKHSKLMMQLAVPAECSLLCSNHWRYRFPLAYRTYGSRASVQVSAYVDAVRKLWQSGIPSDEDFMHLKNLQQFFKNFRWRTWFYNKTSQKRIRNAGRYCRHCRLSMMIRPSENM